MVVFKFILSKLLLKNISAIVLTFTLLGCINSPKTPLHVKSLEQILQGINGSISKEDARMLSYEMLSLSAKLKDDYRLVTPPSYHNFLVNIGARDRGLCWHFAFDMLAHAKELNLKSFDYYIGGAHIDNYWKEHNTLIVTCRGCSFKKGVVLDPWRNSDKLFYSKVTDDSEYKWYQRGRKR